MTFRIIHQISKRLLYIMKLLNNLYSIFPFHNYKKVSSLDLCQKLKEILQESEKNIFRARISICFLNIFSIQKGNLDFVMEALPILIFNGFLDECLLFSRFINAPEVF